MAKKILTPEQKRQKLANVLASYYGMKRPTAKAKKHLNEVLNRLEFNRDHVVLCLPEAKRIIKQRTNAFIGNSTTANL